MGNFIINLIREIEKREITNSSNLINRLFNYKISKFIKNQRILQKFRIFM